MKQPLIPAEIMRLVFDSGYMHGSTTEDMSPQGLLLNPEFWKALCKAVGLTGEKIRMCCGCGRALLNNEKETMDGKDPKCGSDVYHYEGAWLIEMHRYVDALAIGGNDLKYFWQTFTTLAESHHEHQ